IVGGIGVSGDTACADHSVAWRTRIILVRQQPSPGDQLTFATDPAMTNGHPHCPNDNGTQGAL
ncbi:MAG: heme-binding protein, partial [Methylocella sp.]